MKDVLACPLTLQSKDVCKTLTNFLIKRILSKFHRSRILSYLCQKCEKKMGVTDFVCKIKREEEKYNISENLVREAVKMRVNN